MSFKSFITSEPLHTGLLVLGMFSIFNGFTITYKFIYDVYDDYQIQQLADAVETIYDTQDIDRRLELVNKLRESCIATPDWKSLDQDDATYIACDWAMGTDI